MLGVGFGLGWVGLVFKGRCFEFQVAHDRSEEHLVLDVPGTSGTNSSANNLMEPFTLLLHLLGGWRLPLLLKMPVKSRKRDVKKTSIIVVWFFFPSTLLSQP